MERPVLVTKTNSQFTAAEKWVQNTMGIFETGDRRTYLSHLTQVCFLLGIGIDSVKASIKQAHLANDSEFTTKEVFEAIDLAYKGTNAGSAKFDGDKLIDRVSNKPVKIELADGPVEDVIYASECAEAAKNIYRNGYTSAESTGIDEIDVHFKWKRKEATCGTGYGNYGKSEFFRFLFLNKSVKDGTKWGIFGPEDYPAEEFYHGLVEMLIGADCTPRNSDKPREEIYDKAYEFVSKHFFYIFPKEVSPTPEYINSRFLQLIIKEGIDGCVIDPFNQLSNDYSSTGGRDDKYLEACLSSFIRFAVLNNVYYVIIAHPVKPKKNSDGSYDRPTAYDLAGGAMWRNKMDNVLIYHRPNHHTDPTDTSCTFTSDKIRRQKIVGKLGTIEFKFSPLQRRFLFNCNYPVKLWIESIHGKLTPITTIHNYSEPQEKEVRLPKSGRFDVIEDDPFIN
jgi:hypothetical protein